MKRFNYKYCLLSVAIGDYCGSAFEGHHGLIDASQLNDDTLLYGRNTGRNIKNTCTDDTVCTYATAAAILDNSFNFKQYYLDYGRHYIHAGFGPMFRQWLERKRDDYESWGNGSAMRISPIGFYAKTVEELEQLVIDSCKCTHNSKEAILGATVIAQAIFLAKRGDSKQNIMNMFHQRMPEWKNTDFDNYIQYFENKGEIIDFGWYLKCDNIVGMVMKAFEVSDNFEHALYLVISQGYDTDTAGSIMAPLAYAYYGYIPQKYIDKIKNHLDINMILINDIFSNIFVR